MKAIIYCRKSTESEEKQVQSIEAQLDWCRDYAKRLGFEVIKEITEEKSAKKP
jgi:DNA invertase Pin-like site-specific DNA recombinase